MVDPGLAPVARALRRGRTLYLLTAVVFLLAAGPCYLALGIPLGGLLCCVALVVTAFALGAWVRRGDRRIADDPLLIVLAQDPQHVTRVHVDQVRGKAHVYVYFTIGRPRCVLLVSPLGAALEELLGVFRRHAPHALGPVGP